MQHKFIGLYRWIYDQYMANANFMVYSQETARRHLAQDNKWKIKPEFSLLNFTENYLDHLFSYLTDLQFTVS